MSKTKKRVHSDKKITSTEPIRSSSPWEIALFAAELGTVPELDLHNMTPDEARYAADRFIDQQFCAGAEAIKIIHGRGTQRLRQVVLTILREDRVRVAAFRDASSTSQQGGVTYVALHRIH